MVDDTDAGSGELNEPEGLAVFDPGDSARRVGLDLRDQPCERNLFVERFPTSLAGTSVMINGKAAYLAYVSPGQINLQAPDDPTSGAVPVVVSTAAGSATSGAFGGGAYIIGPTGNSLGYPTVAAKAGDLVELFGTGFGPTNPAVPAGQPFAGAAATTNPVNLLIGNASTTPNFAGLSGPGLNQFNLIIPPGLGTGDLSLQAVVAGVSTPFGVVISLQ